jgi:hypothetical protein
MVSSAVGKKKNQPRIREWTNTHAHLSTRIITTLLVLLLLLLSGVCVQCLDAASAIL